MATETSIAPISAQIQKIKEALNQYKASTEAINKAVGPTTAKGMGAVTKIMWRNMKKSLKAIPDKLLGKSTSSGSVARSPRDLGLAYYTTLLASIDLCSILNTIQSLTNVPSQKFNPNQTPEPSSFIWKVQKLAYDTQVIIDTFEAGYSLAVNPGQAILGVITKIEPNIAKLGGTQYLGSPDMRGTYPQVDLFTTFLNDTVKKIADTGEISDTDKVKQESVLKTLAGIRKTCILIQALTTPAGLTNAVLNNLVSDSTLSKLSNTPVISKNPDELAKDLTWVNQTCDSINQILSVTARVLDQFRLVVRISLIIVKVFKILINFFEILPLPNLYTTAGVTTKMSRTVIKLQTYSDDTINLLNEINLLLALIIGTLEGTTAAVDLITNNLSLIVDKLKTCDRDADAPLVGLAGSINAQVTQLNNTNNKIKEFVANYNNKKKVTDSTYYGYTISILSEQIADKQLQLTMTPRRYGVALNSAGIVVVESPLTYASDDSIIVNEVKLLLSAKSLIKSTASIYTAYEMDIITEAMHVLAIDDLNMEDIPVESPTEYIDAPGNENENDELGLNSFVNKLSGGKRLRERVQRIMESVKNKLSIDIAGAKK